MGPVTGIPEMYDSHWHHRNVKTGLSQFLYCIETLIGTFELQLSFASMMVFELSDLCADIRYPLPNSFIRLPSGITYDYLNIEIALVSDLLPNIISGARR